MKYTLAIDQGTSSTRAIIYSTTGQLICMSQYPITQYYPQPGWVEHCPEEIWAKTLQAIQDVTQQIDSHQLIACGITNQRETSVIWDKTTGKCLGKAIVWQDTRTEELCRALEELNPLVRKKTGLLINPYFSATKLNWLLAQHPQARSLADKNQLAFGTMDSFLIWRLTQGKQHLTDITNASRTLLFNIHQQIWDDELLRQFDIPANILPTVLDCDGYFGSIDATFCGKEIPIMAVAGDQQAALIGQQCFDKGMTKATFGTGAFLLMNTGDKPVTSEHQLLTTIVYKIKNQIAYGLEGSIYHAGSSIKWLRDHMKLIQSVDEVESIVASLSDNGGVYFIPAFTGLGAPHWLATHGAQYSGITLATSPAHFVRAALESVCYQTREVLQCMQEDSGLSIPMLRVDGGMTVNHWFLQFLANQCQTLIQKPHDIEATAQGIALLASNSLNELSQDCLDISPTTDPSGQATYQDWLNCLMRLR